MSRNKAYAVLTGDLVGSTGLEPHDLEYARDMLLRSVDRLDDWSDGLVVGRAEFFRGDSWQLLLAEPRYFLRAAMFLRASLRSRARELDTRIGVGFGTVDQIDRSRISLSVGQAFIDSGGQLDEMGNATGITVRAPFGPWGKLGWLAPITVLCSSAMNQWSERQAEIALHRFIPNGPRQSDIASELSISQQSVSKTLVAIDIKPLLSALEWVELSGWEDVWDGPITRLI